jgi:hypothetical protein
VKPALNVMKNQGLTLLGIGLLLAVLGSSCSTESGIKHYSGDGEIKARPDDGFWGGGGGYLLKFKPIKLDRPEHFTYHFAGLPRWKTEALFAIEDSRTWEDKDLYEWYEKTASAAKKEKYKYACYDDLKGTLAMSLKDAKGNVVFKFEKKLRELTWSQAGQGPWELYDEKTINFTPDSREYVLEITIDPDPMLKDNEGYVLFRGGGHEPVSIGF